MPTKRVHRPQLIFEKSRAGRIGCNVPQCDTPAVELSQAVGRTREHLDLPEVSELEVIRHFTNLSQINYGIDTGFYPLGSCTMKYNPRINERTAGLAGFTHLHPLQPLRTVPGMLRVIAEVQDILGELTGFPALSMQPVAGAHGEQTCLMVIRAYHESRGEGQQRRVVLIPDSAHGTNPASAARCGYEVRTVPTDSEGMADLVALEAALDESVAAFMVTNPSTLGLFEKNIARVCELVHAVGGQVFCDGANFNAMVGKSRPGDQGFDCMHLNLHKTFTTPHGGGGPGCGAIGVKAHLEPFLPAPFLRRAAPGESSNAGKEVVDGVVIDSQRPHSIGRVSSFWGQSLMAVRAYTYLLAMGKRSLPAVADYAVLNANYVQARLKEVLPPAHDVYCMHECVLTAEKYKRAHGVRALDISKRLIDYGFHPPTNYFPLIVPECLMIEPTETESKQTLDAFCDALIQICREAETEPDLLHDAPTSQIVGRLDETRAVKDLDVRWKRVASPSAEREPAQV
ncbi:MAG: aminomethyl-transferring glycine dehydrogenase subunit GcvPB [Fimbriimonadaceae bacterium]|nr:aminomethyl-transferring glycine dehydrogenase subunit GcvPB [Fimbriimonadaceae bacterium]QOJ12187.1 MAG: aminomethyl-transferring glycine dehydrogenase subunit GcvPB [Chthonomonadaceae bacterium]RIK01653.1 MAG: aminomethyl-transferring glycine dehydrogenase subunit GcvPB [Armatimonadota bacterium]